MNVSLILTRQCNLRCQYCFEAHDSRFMSEKTALKAIDLAVSDNLPECGVSFFGGEPLLRRDLIYKCVEYAKKFPNRKFYYNMTTNGLLLDEEFLTFAEKNKMKIAISHDGLMSRVNRVYADGRSCLSELDDKLALLLSYQPKTFVMSTVAANTVNSMAQSAIDLYERGVKKLNVSIDMRRNAGWNDELMLVFASQLDEISDYILQKFRAGEDVYFNSFEEKIFNITKCRPKHLCRLGKRKPLIDVDGAIYPCIQFNGLEKYRMGDVFKGIDRELQEKIYQHSLIKPKNCDGCALESRCQNGCACSNFQQCGDMNEVSPVQCTYQRTIIQKADELARKMIEADEEHFIKRYLI